MILLVLLSLFTWGFYSGIRRGFWLQLLYLGGFSFSYFVAATHYRKVATILEMIVPFPAANAETKMHYFTETQQLDLSKIFYAGLAFLLLYFSCYAAFRVVAIFAAGLRFVPFLNGKFRLFSGLGGFCSAFFTSFMVLKLLTIFPNNTLQADLYQHFFVRAMIERIPFFSQHLQELWVVKIIGGA